MVVVKAIRDEVGLHSITLTEGDHTFTIPAPSLAHTANDLIWHMMHTDDKTTVSAPRDEHDDLSA